MSLNSQRHPPEAPEIWSSLEVEKSLEAQRKCQVDRGAQLLTPFIKNKCFVHFLCVSLGPQRPVNALPQRGSHEAEAG